MTAFLGPAFNDWFGSQISANSRLGLRVTNSCNLRRTELEADLLALRILAGADIDPRVLSDILSKGGLFDRIDLKEQKELERLKLEESKDERSDISEGELWLWKNGFMDTHPVNKERWKTVMDELERWIELGQQMQPQVKPNPERALETPSDPPSSK